MPASRTRSRAAVLRNLAAGEVAGEAGAKRAAVYTRISRDRTKERMGVARQEQDCRRLVRERGYTLAGPAYVDDDRSASRGHKRENWQRLMQDVKAGRIDVVVAYDTSRLTRQMSELASFCDEMQKAGCSLSLVVGGDELLETANGEMNLHLMGIMAAFEAKKISERVRRAFVQKRERGEWLGGKRPFGFDFEDVEVLLPSGKTTSRRRLVKNPEEAKEVRRMVREVANGTSSLASLARDLNRRGVTPSQVDPVTGEYAKWSITTVRAVLLRPLNAGLVAYNGEVVAQSAYPALVKEDLWRAAEAKILDTGRQAKVPNVRRHLLSGLALCDVCGTPVKAGSSPTRKYVADANGQVMLNKNGKPKIQTRTVYACGQRRENGGLPKGHPARVAETVDKEVTAHVIARLLHARPTDLLQEDLDEAQQDLAERETALRARVDELSAAYAAGNMPLDDVSTLMRQVRSDLERVIALREPSTKAYVLDGLTGLKSKEQLEAVWTALPLHRKREVISLLFEVRIGNGTRGGGFDYSSIKITPLSPKKRRRTARA